MWYNHTREYYLAINRNQVVIHATAQMNLKNIMLKELPDTKTTYCMISVYVMSTTGNSTETKSRLVVAQGQEGYGKWRVTANGKTVSFRGDENTLIDSGDGYTTL